MTAAFERRTAELERDDDMAFGPGRARMVTMAMRTQAVSVAAVAMVAVLWPMIRRCMGGGRLWRAGGGVHGRR